MEEEADFWGVTRVSLSFPRSSIYLLQILELHGPSAPHTWHKGAVGNMCLTLDLAFGSCGGLENLPGGETDSKITGSLTAPMLVLQVAVVMHGAHAAN